MTKQGDDLVAKYLSRVQTAAVRLEPRQREELLGDLREHIDTARQELPNESESEVRNLLDRLGDPFDIAEAAGSESGAVSSSNDDPSAGWWSRYPVAAVILGGVTLVAVIALACFLLFFVGSSSFGTPVSGAN